MIINEIDSEDNDDDEKDGGGSGAVQLHDAQHTEQWVDEQFDTKPMPFGDGDDEDIDSKQSEPFERRRHREQMSELERPFTVGDLVRGDSTEPAVDDAEFAEMPFLKDFGDRHGDDRDEEEDDGDDYKGGLRMDDDDEFDIDVPAVPERKRKSLILDITKLSQLAAVIEEEHSDGDEEGCFEAVEYETDSDADSNDSVVVKKRDRAQGHER